MTETKTPSRHHHGNLKEALLAYALRAAESGALETLSLRKASRDLGVSPGAAYRHFADRDALMRKVAEIGFDMLAERFETALPFASTAATRADALSRFTNLARAYVAFSGDHPNLWRLMFGPFGLSPQQARADRPSTYAWLAKSLDELAQFDVIDAPNAAAQFFVWSAIHGFSDLGASAALADQPRSQQVDQQCAFMIRALRAAP
ncbi:MAG: TetR/AcrR family transcriptional regulator [Pseudomonadota bacterium]